MTVSLIDPVDMRQAGTVKLMCGSDVGVLVVAPPHLVATRLSSLTLECGGGVGIISPEGGRGVG